MVELVMTKGMAELETLTLWGSMNIGNGEAAALAGALMAGAAPKCTELNLLGTSVGDAGLAAIAEALGRGAMPGLKKIEVERSKGGASKVGRAAVQKVRPGVEVQQHELPRAGGVNLG